MRDYEKKKNSKTELNSRQIYFDFILCIHFLRIICIENQLSNVIANVHYHYKTKLFFYIFTIFVF